MEQGTIYVTLQISSVFPGNFQKGRIFQKMESFHLTMKKCITLTLELAGLEMSYIYKGVYIINMPLSSIFLTKQSSRISQGMDLETDSFPREGDRISL